MSNVNLETKKQKKFRLGDLDPLALVFGVLVLAAILTYIIPGGQFERVMDAATEREVVVPDSFKYIQSAPQGLIAVIKSVFDGLVEGGEIIFFIFIVGGAFAVLKETNAINAGLSKVTNSLKHTKFSVLVMPIVIILFSLAGSVFGMYEEVIPFVGIIVPLALALGYDSLVGVASVYLAVAMGFSGAFMNPFTLGIAQGIAGLPPLSGMAYRIIVWVVVTGSCMWWIMRYAAKVKKDPTKSIIYKESNDLKSKLDLSRMENVEFTLRHKIILLVMLVTFIALGIGVTKYGWYMAEIASLFLTMGIIGGIIGGLKLTKLVEAFIDGMKDMVYACVMIGLAQSIVIILNNGQVIDTILKNLAALISYAPKWVAPQIMFFFQSFLNFIVQSGSGQAAITMPIMAPLSDLLGVTRQTAVLAFQLGDGFTNPCIPWDGLTLAIISIGGVPLWKWLKWVWKYQAIMLLIGSLLLIWPVLSVWGPF